MGWRDWLKEKNSSKKEIQDLLPLNEKIILVPNALNLSITEHKLDFESKPESAASERTIDVPSDKCRSYLTEGLSKLEQKEVMFSLALSDEQLMPVFEKDLVKLLQMIYQLAGQGRVVDYGGLTTFAEKGPFGLPYSGIAYLEPSECHIPKAPEDTLLAVFLKPDEAAAAAASSAYRSAAWIGSAYRIFPYPAFSDPTRSSAVPNKLPETVLSKIPCLQTPTAAKVFLVDKTLILELHESINSQIQQALNRPECETHIGFITGHKSGADSRLVWVPGSDVPQAIGVGIVGDSTVILEGGFIYFNGTQTSNNGMIFEDGFSVLLTEDSWRELKEALVSKAPIDIPIDGRDDRFFDRLLVNYV